MDYESFSRLNFTGLRVIESAYLTEDGAPMTVRRSWKERLFTRPWRPLEATRTFTPQIPLRKALRVGNTLFIHPHTARLQFFTEEHDALSPRVDGMFDADLEAFRRGERKLAK